MAWESWPPFCWALPAAQSPTSIWLSRRHQADGDPESSPRRGVLVPHSFGPPLLVRPQQGNHSDLQAETPPL